MPVAPQPSPSRRSSFPWRRALLLGSTALFAWVAGDLYIPRRVDVRHFDGVAVGRIEAEMWRSYYERRQGRLFWQLVSSLREQYHAGFWRALRMSYHAAKSAFLFKDGRTRDDYAKALPDLIAYFREVRALSLTPFDPNAVARDELEWWIIRREPARFTTADWERLVASVAAQLYGIPLDDAVPFAKLRVEAMALRDNRGEAITNDDWQHVQALLERGWSALASAAGQ